MYVEIYRKMDRGATANGVKPENQQFLSPVLELAQSLQGLSTTRCDLWMISVDFEKKVGLTNL